MRDGKVLGEVSWGEFAKEAEMLIPSLNKMLQDAGVALSDLNGVFVVSGPGSFSAIRVGVVTANTFIQNLGIDLYAMTTFDLMEKMHNEFDYIVLNGGGSTALVRDGEDIKSVKVTDFNSNYGRLAADLTDKQLDLLDEKFELIEKSLKFSELCARMSQENKFKNYEIKELPLLPYYVKKPSIS